jgi:hypothetical protein
MRQRDIGLGVEKVLIDLVDYNLAVRAGPGRIVALSWTCRVSNGMLLGTVDRSGGRSILLGRSSRPS